MLTISLETKPNITALSFETKAHGETWDQATYTLDQALGTWDVPGVPLIEETKPNIVALTFEAKL